MSAKSITMTTFSKNQWLTLIVFSVADFCSAICVSIQAPFYPEEAEHKGASPTQYGLVFGVYEATVFIVSPLLGKYLNKLGARRVFIVGTFTTGICAVMFGLLNRFEDTDVFVGFSFFVRMVQGAGNAGFLTASFAIVASEFPDRVATMFASLETFFGLGLIVGPAVGASLFELGGFSLPFIVMGFLLVMAACLALFILPEYQDYCREELADGKGILDAFKVPSVMFSALSVFGASISIGFLQATLEPHMRTQFHLSTMMVGVMFMINGGMYAVSAPCWGWLCDNCVNPTIIIMAGSSLVTISFSLIGPLPIFHMENIYEVCILGLVLHGLGFGAEVVSGFVLAHKGALNAGFPDNLSTYGLISGLWTSTFALGACVGPSVAGFLVDSSNFRSASLFVVIIHAALLLVAILFLFTELAVFSKRKNYHQIDDLENSRHSEGYSSADGTLDESPVAELDFPRNQSSLLTQAPSWNRPFLPCLGENMFSVTPTTPIITTPSQCSTPAPLNGNAETINNSGRQSEKEYFNESSPFIFPSYQYQGVFSPNQHQQQHDTIHIIPNMKD